MELLTQLLPMGGIQTVNSAEGMILSGQFRLQTDAVGGAPMEMVTGLELGDLMEPPRDRPSLILCRRGEDSLWEIAKRCGSTVEKIEEANGLTVIPSSGQLLLIPVS